MLRDNTKISAYKPIYNNSRLINARHSCRPKASSSRERIILKIYLLFRSLNGVFSLFPRCIERLRIWSQQKIQTVGSTSQWSRPLVPQKLWSTSRKLRPLKRKRGTNWDIARWKASLYQGLSVQLHLRTNNVVYYLRSRKWHARARLRLPTAAHAQISCIGWPKPEIASIEPTC